MAGKINGLTENQWTELHTMLLQKQDDLIRKIKAKAAAEADYDKDHLIEEMDVATESQMQAVNLRVMDKELKLLPQIQRALDKFEDEEYGLCEGTGEPIGYARLRLVPWARYSVEYKREKERREKTYARDRGEPLSF